MQRLDKTVASIMNITRKEASKLIARGLVFVDLEEIRDGSKHVDENSKFVIDSNVYYYNEFVYIMMNKPKGVVSASEGESQKNVIDILPDEMKRRGLFPAGRLDKDTTGFVLITDDGKFAHDILSPKKHIDKTYIATLNQSYNNDLVKAFTNGVELKNDTCLSAEITALNDEKTKALVVLHQGLYHQVKRMFGKFGIDVVELKRIKIGNLELDKNLEEGQSRYLTKEELKQIKNFQD